MDTENQYGCLSMQQYLLPIMDDIDRVCRKHNIKYTISDGSLLGAIRHKGFIPWDDDIDLSLDRANLNKLLAVFDSEVGEQYTIVYDIWVPRISRKDNPHKNEFPPEGCVDLWIIDRVPKNKFKQKVQVLLLAILQGMMKPKASTESFSFSDRAKLFVTHVLGKQFSIKRKQNWYEAVSQWGNNEESGQLARFNGAFLDIKLWRYASSVIKDYHDVEFEGRKYMALEGWDEVLTTEYGDYMKIPDDKNKRTTHEHTESVMYNA